MTSATETVKEIVTNDKLQNAVATMVNKSIAAFEAGADFLSEQIPDVLHQLLMWHAIHSALLCLSGIILGTLLIIIDIKTFKPIKEFSHKSNDYFTLIMGWGGFGTIIRVPLWLLVYSLLNLTWLQIWIAPKVWLIEYATSLMK